jgi:uncharacterized membrane protein
MIVVLLAFSSALFYGVRAIFIKKGLKDSEPLAAALVNLIISSITQSLFLLISLPSIFSTEHTLYFFLAGVFICLSSVLGPIAIHRLGVSLSSPIQGSYPLFAAVIGIVILRELFSPFIYFGIGLIVMGIVSLSYKETGGVKGWRKIDLIYPLGSAIAISSASILKKVGLTILDAPLLGSLISTVTGLSLYISYLTLSKRLGKVRLTRRSFIFFSLSGISYAIATTIFTFALRIGEITIITPLVSTSTLFTTFLSYMFLRDVEILNRRMILGSILVVLGVIIITVF